MKPLQTEFTNRGFANIEFTDRYGAKCSVQKSSLATEDAIWFGINDADPKIMASDAIRMGLKPREGGEKDNGWVKFEIPEEVSLSTRMHLTVDQVKALLPVLRHFVKHGELPVLE